MNYATAIIDRCAAQPRNRFVLTIVATALAVLLRWAVDPLLGDLGHYIPFYLSVALVAGLAGWRAGLVAVALGMSAAFYLFVYLPGRLDLGLPQDFVHLVLSGLVCTGICFFADWGRRQHSKLRESDRRYRFLVDSVPQIVWSATPEGAQDFANRRWFEFTGLPEGPTAPDVWREICHPDDLELTATAWANAIRTGEPYTCLHRIRRHDGQYRWVLSSAMPQRNGEARVLRWFGTGTDITDRKEAEEALRRSDDRFRQLADATPQLVWTATPDGTVDYYNRRVEEYEGITRSAGGSWDWAPVLHEDDVQPTAEAWQRALAAGETYQVEHRVRLRDGQYRWHLSRGVPMRDEEARVVKWFGTATDIHDSRLAQEQLSRTVGRLQLLSEISAELLASPQPVAAIQSLCKRVMEHLDCQLFFNFLAEDSEKRLHLNARAGISEETARGLQWLEYGEAICGTAAKERRPIIVEDVLSTRDPLAGRIRDLGVQAYACHPLLNQDKLVGTLSFGSRTKPRFREDELALMRVVADQVAIAVQRERLMESVEEQAAKARSANRAKSQFLANMSHELRTPMSAILGMTDLALAEPLSPTVRDFVQTAKESADVLLELLNELLDFSRIEAGRFELESAPFSLQRTVDQVLKTLGVRAYEKGLELICDIPRGVPDRLVGDPLRLRQVLVNLLGNAVKFTARGEVVLRAAVQQQSEGEVTLAFSVADTGIGIAPEDQERIFSPFVQADASTTREYGGSGLGLAITSSLVKLMGGRIWVESHPGRGSTFFFTVRLRLQQDVEQEEAAAVDADTLRDLPVLVVAQNATSRHILERVLLSWSMRPETAADVPSALAQIHEAAALGDPFRLVLTDAVLSAIDGFTLVDWLRSQPELAGPVILMLSPAERQSNAERCRAAGTICLDKPVSRSDLLTAITRALGTARKPAADRHDEAASHEPAARMLRVLLAEDTPANQKLVVHILKSRGHQVEVANNGRQALDLLQQDEFDLMLMDVQMPILDGFQATAAIRKLPGPKSRVPIIAMTAHALKGDQERCLAAGMDGYISKPISGHDLIASVERLGTKAENGQSNTESGQKGMIFNLDEAVARCFGKYPMFQQMVGCFYDEADELLARMRAAVSQSDAAELARLAHRLRGTIVYLAAQAAADAARRVEQVGNSGDLAGAAEAIDALERQLEYLKDALSTHRAEPEGSKPQRD